MAYVLALYEGKSIGSLDLIDVSTDPGLTTAFAELMLEDPPDPRQSAAAAAVDQGRRRALEMVQQEWEE